jgi:hypothetical protein
MLQPGGLLFQALQPFGLIDSQAAICFLPAIVRLLGDPELPTDLEHRQAFAGFKFNRPQMLNNLFRRVPFLGHEDQLPSCGLV